VLATTLLLAALALTLTFLGSAPTGTVGAGALDVVIVSLSSLTIFLLPLIALLISHDTVVGDMERGTMILLLSYPVARWQVLMGKFVGHIAILAVSTILGFGAAAVALVLTGSAVDMTSWNAFASMVGSSILLGAVFVAIGQLVSTLAQQRGTAAGAAIGIWLGLVLIYDMALLGLLVVDQGRFVSGPVLNALLMLNPTDVYRMYNLAGSANASVFSGMAGLADTVTLEPRVLLGALAAWAAVPLACAALVFSRREV
jgi:Cu-processing system permease protein